MSLQTVCATTYDHHWNSTMSETTNISSDTILRVYFDATQTIRHFDGERTSTHRLAIAVLGGLLAFTGSTLFSSEMILVTSAVGMAMSFLFLMLAQKYSYLIQRERLKARAASKLLSSIDDQSIERVDHEKKVHSKLYFLSRTRISTLWSALYITMFLGFLGVFVFHFSATL